MRRVPLLVGALVLALASSASAKMITFPQYYGDPRIAYYDRSGFRAAVDEGASLWNNVGSPLQFQRVSSLRQADIVVSSVDRLPKNGDGEHVAGIGGPGFVKLSRAVNHDRARAAIANTVAHELGHAVGLAHSRDDCALMYGKGSNTLSCPGGERADSYRCGPQAPDVRALAKVWGWKPKITAQTGFCKFVPPAAELTPQDVPETTYRETIAQPGSNEPPGPHLRMYVRNLDSTPWLYDLVATPVDENGNYQNNGCVQPDESGGWIGFEMDNVKPVRKGAVAVFMIYICGQPGETRTFRFRLASKWFVRRPFVFGPTWTVTVHFERGDADGSDPD